MRTIVGSSNKNTKDIKKAERIVNLDKNILAVPTNVSQYGAGGSDIKELETAKHWASEAEKSANRAETNADKTEDFFNKVVEAADDVLNNTEDSLNYLKEIREISVKIDGQETNIETLEKSTVTHANSAAADAQIASDSASQARASEANAAASASSANNSAVSAKESELKAKASEVAAEASAVKADQKLAQTEAVYDKTIDDVSNAVQSYLKDKGNFDPSAGLPTPDSWVNIFGERKNLSCLWVAEKAGTVEGIGFNEGDVLLYNAIVDRYGRFSGELVTGGGGGPTEFFNDIKLSADKRLLGTDSKGSAVELIKLVNDIVEAGDKTKPMHILAKDPKSAFVCIANTSSGFDNYEIYHTGNKPTAADVGAHSKAEADAKFLDLAGTNAMSGPLNTTNTIYVKTKEVYHPGNKPPASDLDAVSLTKSETISGQKKFTQNPIVENASPQISFAESDTNTTVSVKVESKKLTMSTPTSTPFDVDFNNSSVVMSNPKAKTTQGTTADALVRKDYADAELAKKMDKTGGTVSGDVVVKGKITVEGAGSLFTDINTTGQVKENNIRVYSPANKPNAIDVGALPISGGSVGGALHVVGNITTDGTISEKGQRVYSPNNKPTPSDIGASVAADEWKLKSKGIGSSSSATDFDTIIDLGWYHSSSAANLYTNAPSGSSGAFTLYVDSIGPSTTTYRRQTVYDYNSSKTWVREKVTNGWRGWAQVYDTRNKPTAADVGAIGIDNVYNKAQADERFWQRTETVNRAFSADATNSYTKSASDFKDVSNFRSFTTASESTGWDGAAGSGIFQGRMSGTLNYGWAFYNHHASNLLSFGKQKADGSGFTWYKLYHEGNKPSAADINTYTKSEIDSKDSLKLNLTGGTLTGSLTVEGTSGVVNVNNKSASNFLTFINDIASIRYGGSGVGSGSGFQICGSGNQVKLSVSEQGSLTSASEGRVYGDKRKPTAVDVGALPITGGTMASGGIILQQAFPASGNQAHIFHDCRGTTSTPAVLRSMRESTGATWLWEKVVGGSIRYSTGTTGAGTDKIRMSVNDGKIYLGNADKEVYHEGNLLFSKTPDANKLVQRTDAGAIQASSFVSPGDFRVTVAPGGGQKTGGAAETGSIKITLPRWKTATMMKVHISVYNYVSDTSFDVIASGYEYSDGVWHNCSAVITGASATTNHPVYFGNDGSKACIWIGTVGAKWVHPKIVVSKIETGYSGGNNDLWGHGWNISFVTALGTVSRTISDCLIKPSDAANIADTEPTANTIVRRSGTGGGAFKGRVLISSSNDTDVGVGTASLDFVSSAGTVYGQVGDVDNSQDMYIKSTGGARVRIDSDLDVAVSKGSVAQRLMSGGLLASNSFADVSNVPANGIYSKGDIVNGSHLRIAANNYLNFNSGNIGLGWGIRELSSNGFLEFSTRSGTGAYSIKAYLDTTGELYVAGDKKVYHQGFKPTAGDVGAFPNTNTSSLDQDPTTWPNNLASGIYVQTWPGASRTVAAFNCRSGSTRTLAFSASYNGELNYHSNTDGNRWGTFKVYTSGSKPTAADVGALPITGGTLTGALTVPSTISTSLQTGTILRSNSNSDFSDFIGINDGSGAGGAYIGKKNYWIRTGNATEQPKVIRNGTAYLIYHEGNKPTATDVDLSNYKNASSVTHGSVEISGQKGNYAGIHFSDFKRTLMINATVSGIYKSDAGAWQWYFTNDTLTSGKIPWARIPDAPATATRWPTAAEAGALASNGTAVAATKLATARTIAGVSFDGTANISIGATNVGTVPINGNSTAQNGFLNLIATNYALGQCLYKDVDFASGSNSVAIYNNTSGSGVTHTRESNSTAPNASKQVIKITHNPSAGTSPGYGGFITNMASAANKIFVQVFVAKLDSGREWVTAENSMGTNAKTYWATSNKGTGKWERYIRVTMCGDSGSFSGGGHTYVTGGSSSTFYSYLAEATVYDVTNIALPFSRHNKPTAADIDGVIASSGDVSHSGRLTFTGDGLAAQGLRFLKSGANDAFGIRSINSTGNDGELEFWSSDDDVEPFVFRHYTNGLDGTGSRVEWFRIDNTGAKVNGNLVYHAGRKPSAADVGAYSQSESNSRFAYKAGAEGQDFTARRVTTTGTGNDYASGGAELRGNGSTNTVFPTLGFHQPGLFASSLQLRAAADFRFYNQGASGYAKVTVGELVSSGRVTGTQFKVDANAGYFAGDANYTTFTGSNFYIQAGAPTTYIYSPNIYLGNTTGTTVHYRGNALSGNNWSMSTGGGFAAVAVNSTGTGSGQGLAYNGKTVAGGTNDGWMRLNPHNQFGSGIYCGSTGTLRHDSSVQAGGWSGSAKVAKMQINHYDSSWAGNGVAAFSVNNADTSGAHWALASYYDGSNIRSGIQILSNSGGNMRFYTNRRGNYVEINSGSITAQNNVTAYSDRRVKDNIKNIPNALEKVMKLNGVTYTRTDQEDKEKLHTGVIAQEVEAVLPEAVITSENGDIKDFKSVAYGNLVGLLIEAIKELKQEIEELKCKK